METLNETKHTCYSEPASKLPSSLLFASFRCLVILRDNAPLWVICVAKLCKSNLTKSRRTHFAYLSNKSYDLTWMVTPLSPRVITVGWIHGHSWTIFSISPVYLWVTAQVVGPPVKLHNYNQELKWLWTAECLCSLMWVMQWSLYSSARVLTGSAE